MGRQGSVFVDIWDVKAVYGAFFHPLTVKYNKAVPIEGGGNVDLTAYTHKEIGKIAENKINRIF